MIMLLLQHLMTHRCWFRSGGSYYFAFKKNCAKTQKNDDVVVSTDPDNYLTMLKSQHSPARLKAAGMIGYALTRTLGA